MHSQGIIVLIETKPVWQGLQHLLQSKNVKARAITEITKENIDYCKELLKFSEVRHLDNVKGSFSIADRKDYHGTAIVQRSKPVLQIISSTVNAFVEQQQYFFDTLWNKSIKAEQRIREIEEEIAPDFMQTIIDRTEIQNIQYNLLKSALFEILVIFPTIKAFHYYDKYFGIVQIFKEVLSKNSDIQIKILTPNNENIKNIGQKLKEQYPKNIHILYFTEQSEPKILILVVDKKYSLYLEIKDDVFPYNDSNMNTNNNIYTIYGLASYSNSKATVIGYASIFENLWKQTELLEKLKESEELQKDFIHIAAHELKNPIQPILGLSSQLLKYKVDDNKYYDLLNVINRNAKKLIQLTNDILDITKIDTNNLNLNKELFNLGDLISDIIEDYNNQLDNENVKLISKFIYSNKIVGKKGEEGEQNKNNIRIFADRARINQVISNLLNNAIKFTDKGFIDIIIEKKYAENKVNISVKDTGCGIDQIIFPKLFSKFATKSKGGTGLGLYISKNIIEAHDGQIYANNNKDGKGSTFGFSLPLIKKGI
jgi:two-component system, OmpR family, sensor histidine kinase VicK